MPGKELEHVVEKTDPRGDPGLALAVQVEPQADVGLASRASDFGDSCAIELKFLRSLAADRLTITQVQIRRSSCTRPGADCNETCRVRSAQLFQDLEQPVDLRVGADRHPQPVGISGIGHQPDQDLAILELLERLAGRRALRGPDEVGLAVRQPCSPSLAARS